MLYFYNKIIKLEIKVIYIGKKSNFKGNHKIKLIQVRVF